MDTSLGSDKQQEYLAVPSTFIPKEIIIAKGVFKQKNPDSTKLSVLIFELTACQFIFAGKFICFMHSLHADTVKRICLKYENLIMLNRRI